MSKKVTMCAIRTFLKTKLGTDPMWAVRALTKIYAFQTQEEQDSLNTHYNNDVGFSGVDAELLSSFAQQIEKGRSLSEKQMVYVFKKMPKYWKQILSISDRTKLESMVVA